LLARAVTAGAAAWLIADVFLDVPDADAVRWALLGGVSAVMALSWMETISHGSRHVELAVHAMVKGEHGSLFWAGLGLGCALPFVLAIVALTGSGAVALSALAGVAALIGMFLSETAFVRAGQSVPLS
jgi:hypothetical protein